MPANRPHHGIVHDLAPQFFEPFQLHVSSYFLSPALDAERAILALGLDPHYNNPSNA
jgi:hypothetical protein